MAAERRPILIAGPTASGKSALALDLAARFGGAVVNADAMQVYRELRVLTARPSASEEAAAPHFLYGHVGAGERYSVGRWLADVAAMLDRLRQDDLRPILVGGTGLYFKALTEGLAVVPAIPAEIRARWEAAAQEWPAEDLHHVLEERDREGAAALRPSDRTRIVRALEVLDATGRPLRYWQGRPAAPLLALTSTSPLVLDPDRSELHGRIDRRVAAMVEAGAVEEVARLMALELNPALPAMKAIGVRPFAAHIREGVSLAVAIARTQAETRQYAKRQATWFRNQTPGWPRMFSAADAPASLDAILRRD